MTAYSKRFYRLAEVSAMLNLPPSTINYWVQVFPELDPPTTKGGHRRYRPADIDLIRHIAVMMHDKGMQIEGAKRQLRLSKAPARGYKCASAEDAARLISEVREAVKDNPKAIAMLDAVAKWVNSVNSK